MKHLAPLLLLASCAYPEPIIWAHEDPNYASYQADVRFCKTMAEEFSHGERSPTLWGAGIGGGAGALYGVAISEAVGQSGDTETIAGMALLGLLVGAGVAYNEAHEQNITYYKACITRGSSRSAPHVVKGWQ